MFEMYRTEQRGGTNEKIYIKDRGFPIPCIIMYDSRLFQRKCYGIFG